MENGEQSKRSWAKRLAKWSTFMGCGLFLFSTALTPMDVTVSWPFFLATYGVTLLLGLLGLAGFLLSLRRGVRLSPVYAVCPALFVTTFFVVTLSPIYRLQWYLVFP